MDETAIAYKDLAAARLETIAALRETIEHLQGEAQKGRQALHLIRSLLVWARPPETDDLHELHGFQLVCGAARELLGWEKSSE